MLGLILLVALVLPLAARAQEPGGPQGQRMREAVREKVKAYRISRLIEVLGLDERAATRLMPLVNKAYDEIAVVTKDSGEARRELQEQMAAPRADEARLNQLIDRMLANRARIERVEEDLIRETRKVLSAAQVGQLVITLPEINHEIQQQIRRAAKGGGRGHQGLEEPGPAPGPPGAPDDPE